MIVTIIRISAFPQEFQQRQRTNLDSDSQRSVRKSKKSKKEEKEASEKGSKEEDEENAEDGEAEVEAEAEWKDSKSAPR